MSGELIPLNGPATYTLSTFAGQAIPSEYSKGRSAIFNALAVGLPNYTSEKTRELETRFQKLRNPTSPSMMGARPPDGNLQEQLFDATANAKVLTSQVAMYLDMQWRSKLFGQIDFLHDADEWEKGDKPLQKESFATFLKAICELKPNRKPGLGLTPFGQLIAAWTNGTSRLTIEFSGNGRVKWVISRMMDDETEHYVGDTTVGRLAAGLQSHNTDEWFN